MGVSVCVRGIVGGDVSGGGVGGGSGSLLCVVEGVIGRGITWGSSIIGEIVGEAVSCGDVPYWHGCL